jgi:hypothetical protein
MHIHDSTHLNYTNVNPSASVDNAAARVRAENVRKRLMASANETDGISSPDELNLIGQWMDSRHSQTLPDDEYHAAVEGREPDF